MPEQVVNNALLECTMGTTPSPLTVTNNLIFQVNGQLAATVMDFAPMANVKPFGMCRSMANPQVASATAAAQGVLTPMPCVPATAAPWAPSAFVTKINGLPALLSTAQCLCSFGGSISVQQTGQGVPTLQDM